jgi:D-alanine-D-alanine ligase
MKRLRVLAMVHEELVPPEDPGDGDVVDVPWKVEYDIVSTLRDMGHEVRVLGVGRELRVIREAVEELRPHIAFNLLESFHDISLFDSNVVAYLELLRVAYTGCNPRGLLLSRDKSLSKKILAYHRIACPNSIVFPRGRRPRLPKRLRFPLIVKAVAEDASAGISQASVVESEDKVRERVAFIHESVGAAAIAEEYIEGRELYVGVLGNRRLQVLPVWELQAARLPSDGRLIATERVKFSRKHQEKYGITWGPAEVLDAGVATKVQQLAKRVFRALELTGYARIDFRLDGEGRPWVLEANANPDLGYGAELAESAHVAGLDFEALLSRILALGLAWRQELGA